CRERRLAGENTGGACSRKSWKGSTDVENAASLRRTPYGTVAHARRNGGGGWGRSGARSPPLHLMPRKLAPDFWLFGVAIVLLSAGVVMGSSASAIPAAAP